MSKKGKIIFILAALLIIIAIVVGVVLGLRKISTTPNIQTSFPVASSSQNANVGNGSTEDVQSQVHGLTDSSDSFSPDLKRLTLLTKNPVVTYWVASLQVLGEQIASSSPLQSAVFYMNSDGDIVRIHDDGKEAVVSHLGEAPLHITQSASGARIIVEFTSGSFALFDVSRGAFEFLPQGTASAVFSVDGNKLAYLVADSSGKQELFIRDLTSTKKIITKVFSLSLSDMKLAWPMGSRIYLFPPQSANFSGEIWYFDTTAKTMNLFVSGLGVGALFSHVNSSSLIFHNEDKSSISASFQDIKTGSSTPFSASTWLSKCSFSFDAADVVCAIPQTRNKMVGVELPDDYNSMALFTNDSLQLFSSTKGYAAQDILVTTQAQFDAKDIRTRAQQVFFVDRLTDGLYMFDMRGL